MLRGGRLFALFCLIAVGTACGSDSAGGTTADGDAGQQADGGDAPIDQPDARSDAIGDDPTEDADAEPDATEDAVADLSPADADVGPDAPAEDVVADDADAGSDLPAEDLQAEDADAGADTADAADAAPDAADAAPDAADTAPDTTDAPADTADATPDTADATADTGDTADATVDAADAAPDLPPTDIDEDGHLAIADGGDDCDDNDPLRFPGNPEVCDGIDNDCGDDIDEGVITDGAGCQDPGPPEVGATASTVTFNIRNGNSNGDDTSSVTEYCLSSSDCWNGTNAINWNDHDVRLVDVYHLTTSLAVADIDFVRIRYDDADNWQFTCVQTLLDGEPFYCEEHPVTLGGIAVEYTDLDPTNSCDSCWPAVLTHGPMVGATTATDVRIWVRTDATRRVALRMRASEGAMQTSDPVAYAYPSPDDDFTHTFHIRGLQPNTTYYYDLEVAGERFPALAQPAYRFTTAPVTGAAGAFRFAFGSCTRSDPERQPSQPAFGEVDALDPDLFLMVGDNMYADAGDLAAPSNLPGMRAFYRDAIQRRFPWAVTPPVAWGDYGRDARATLLDHTPTLATWDDHDFIANNLSGVNNGVPDPARVVGRRTFMEYWANPAYGEGGHGIYFSHSWGDVDFFVLDGRYFRDSDGSDMLGGTQRLWLLDALADSTATFKLIVMGSGWSSESSNDAWGAHLSERDEIFAFIRDEAIDGVVLMSGDVHRSEMRMLPGADGGYTIPELVSSPLANNRGDCPGTNEFLAPGDNETCYGADTGALPSFIAVDVDTTLADPTLVATIYSSTGTAISTWTIRASRLTNRSPSALPARSADFNGDGYADLAVGAPDENVDETDDGMVHVLYGTTGGLHSRGNVTLHQGDLSGANETGDNLGFALSHGDYNGDGYSDLAIGAPGEAIGDLTEAGRVSVVYGSAAGLDASTEQSWHQDTAGIKGTAVADDRFGAALASGDFNGDGQEDLAVGVPNNGGGAVNVIYGSPTGLVADGGNRDDELLDQDNTSAVTADEAGDLFGFALAAGDFDGDGFVDLAIGAPNEDRTGAAQAGFGTVVHGSASGLDDGDESDDLEFGIDAFGVTETADDFFAFALAAGDFDGDGFDDLAIGAPGRGVDEGRVGIAYGSAISLSNAGLQYLSMNDFFGAVPVDGDRFGAALATGDFDGNGSADLAIGAPGRNTWGVVGVVRASDTVGVGLVTTRVQLLDQNWGIWSTGESGDDFGWALAAGDFDGDGRSDLAVGAPDENIGSTSNAGAVEVFFGGPNGMGDTTPALAGSRYTQRWHQDIADIPGATEAGDHVGISLSR